MSRPKNAMIVGALAILAAGSGCGSDPCRAACSKYDECFGAGEAPACPFSSACEGPAQRCLARCITGASCGALTGSDLVGVVSLASCKAACEADARDGGGAKDGTSAADAGPGPDGGGTECPPPRVRCGGACVDLGTPQHCSKCGDACPAGQLCVGGSCQQHSGDCATEPCPGGYYCDLATNNCLSGCAVDSECGLGAKCNVARHECCAPGQSVCGGACADLASDPSHCGQCGQACPGVAFGQAVCNAGDCGLGCDGDRTLCGAQCVSTASDSQHCGGCDKPCTSPSGGSTSCVGGQCTAACANPSHSQCGDQCVDLETDLANCGSCGNACPDGGGTPSCTAGKCSVSCPASTTLCAGSCVDLQSDPDNCGTCGKQCPEGVTNSSPKCSSGKCGFNCYSPAVSCVDTCCDPTRYGGSHCCTGKDQYGKTYGYCLKSGYTCY